MQIPGILGTADLFVDGRSRPARNGETFDDFDPATGHILTTVALADEDDVQDAIDSARSAQKAWAKRPPRERGQILLGIASEIRKERHALSVLESLDTGKPLSQAEADVEVAAQYFEFYGGFADKLYGDTIPLDGSRFAATFHEPLGVTGHIIPWNYPLQIGARTTAPSLMVGNACVLKPAAEAPLTALVLARLASSAGLSDGLLNVVPGTGPIAGACLAASDGIDHLSFTGGVETGRLVLHAAAENLKPTTMELGGKSPSIVLEDADIDRAVPVIAKALIQNAGQTCSAGTRVLVHANLHDEFVDRLKTTLSSVTIGPGVDNPDMGPLISEKQLDRVLGYLEIAASEGATIAAGGKRGIVPDHEDGYFVEPTLLTEANTAMRVAQEEIFGPVLTVLPFSTDVEAVELANSTDYGLIAAVWTRDADRAIWLARNVDAGQVYINSYGAGGGVALPFGGYRRSGFGREKGLEAVREYTQTKTIAFDVQNPA